MLIPEEPKRRHIRGELTVPLADVTFYARAVDPLVANAQSEESFCPLDGEFDRVIVEHDKKRKLDAVLLEVADAKSGLTYRDNYYEN